MIKIDFIAFFGGAFFSSLFIHFKVAQPAWPLIVYSCITGILFIVLIIREVKKG